MNVQNAPNHLTSPLISVVKPNFLWAIDQHVF